MDELIERYTIDTGRIYFIDFSGGAKLLLHCDGVAGQRHSTQMDERANRARRGRGCG